MSDNPSPLPYQYHSCPPSLCTNPTTAHRQVSEEVDWILVDIWRNSALGWVMSDNFIARPSVIVPALVSLVTSSRDDPTAEAIYLAEFKSQLYAFGMLTGDQEFEVNILLSFADLLVRPLFFSSSSR